MFDIRILNRVAPEGAFGEVVIGRHRENFSADLSVWNIEDYRASWIRTAAHIVEHSYGRFVISVGKNGVYETWACARNEDSARFHRAIMLSSVTRDFDSPADAEAPVEDYTDRHEERPTVNYYRCAFIEVAAFEARMRGGVMN